MDDISMVRREALPVSTARADLLIQSASIVTHLENEMKLHIAYCEELGMSLEDVNKSEESQGKNTDAAAMTLNPILTRN